MSKALLFVKISLLNSAILLSYTGQSHARHLSINMKQPLTILNTQIKSDQNPQSIFYRKYNTIAHKLLDAEIGAGNITPDMYANIDKIIDISTKSLKPLPINITSNEEINFASKMLKKLDSILVEQGFVYPGKGAVLLLSDGLSPTFYKNVEYQLLIEQSHNVRRQEMIKRKAPGPFYVVDCDIASYFYLAVGEIMNYPIQLVDIPNHNFIRWKLKNNGYINFETMDGIVTNDQYYIKEQIPINFIGKSSILNSMEPKEVFAYHENTVAIGWSWKKRYDKMVEKYLHSITLDSKRVFAFNNLAWYYSAVPDNTLRNGEKALIYAKKASTLFPSGDVMDTLACAYAQAGDFINAVKTEKKALKIKYRPFESDIIGNLRRFTSNPPKTCNDEKFGIDLQPFRPDINI